MRTWDSARPQTESPTWRARGLSKSFISRVIIGVTPFRVLITLLITYLLSPLPLQVVSRGLGLKSLGVWGLGVLVLRGFRGLGF